MPKAFRALARSWTRKDKGVPEESDSEEEANDDVQHDEKIPPIREEPVDEVPWSHLSGEWRSDELLLPEIEEMYWDGVKRELEVVLLTMKQWQEQQEENEDEDESIALPEETEVDFVHGYDTFIDQVSEESRKFARRYGMQCSLATFSQVFYPS